MPHPNPNPKAEESLRRPVKISGFSFVPKHEAPCNNCDEISPLTYSSRACDHTYCFGCLDENVHTAMYLAPVNCPYDNCGQNYTFN